MPISKEFEMSPIPNSTKKHVSMKRIDNKLFFRKKNTHKIREMKIESKITWNKKRIIFETTDHIMTTK